MDSVPCQTGTRLWSTPSRWLRVISAVSTRRMNPMSRLGLRSSEPSCAELCATTSRLPLTVR